MVKQVIYIEKEKFLRQLMEVAFRAKGAEIYTADTLAGNQYLIDDIKPDILIIDLESSEKEDILEVVSKNEKAKIILTSSNSLDVSPEIASKITSFLQKPLLASSIAQRILDL